MSWGARSVRTSSVTGGTLPQDVSHRPEHVGQAPCHGNVIILVKGAELRLLSAGVTGYEQDQSHGRKRKPIEACSVRKPQARRLTNSRQ
jgi:hypothetical protein